MKTGLSCLFILLTISSMAQTAYKTLTVDSGSGAFRISVPVYMKEVHNLRNGQGFQLNGFPEGNIMMIVLTEKKSGVAKTAPTHKDYFRQSADSVAAGLAHPDILPTRTGKAGSLPYIQGGIKGELLGTRVNYYLRTYESENYFFQVLIWVEAQTDEQSNIGETIWHIMDSFELVNGK